MNKTVNFEDIYNDFFGKNSYIKETQSVIKIDYEKEIKKLYITSSSKELLTKIINYILNYKDGTYVNFNIKLVIKNKEVVNSIINLINNAIKTNNYTKSIDVNTVSFYKLDNISKLENNCGICVYKDLEGLNVHDNNYVSFQWK